MENDSEKIKKFLENIPDTFEIMEEAVDSQTQKEYMEYSESFTKGELSDEKTLSLSKLLYKSNFPVDAKKKTLVLLAHLGTVSAYREIEKFYKTQDDGLKKWSALALQECKMFLESELLDVSMGFISTGLGGVKDKLRFYFLILPLNNAQFNDNQHKTIVNEFATTAEENNSCIEAIESDKEYVGFTALIPMDVAVGNFIESGIEKCNELGGFVFEHYYVTNCQLPSKQEIEDIISIVRSD